MKKLLNKYKIEYALLLILISTNVLLNSYYSNTHKLDMMKSELELSTFFKITPNILGIATLEKFTKVNDKFVELLGYYNNELTTNIFLSFIHPDDVEKTKIIVQDAIRGDVIVNFENRYRKFNGEYLTIKWQAILKDEIFYVSGIDVTEERRLMSDAIESEYKFTKFFDLSLIPMCTFDRLSFEFIDVNSALCVELGYSMEELINVNISKFVHPDDLEKSIKSTNVVINDPTNTIRIDYENRFICKNGLVRKVIWNSILSKSEDRIIYCTARFK